MLYYTCKQYVAARARNFQTFLGRLWSEKCGASSLLSTMFIYDDLINELKYAKQDYPFTRNNRFADIL